MSISRRVFLKNGALAVVGTAAVPAFLTRAAFAAGNSSARKKKLVVIFQRGAADGLNIVIPHAEPNYFSMRPSIAIPRNQILDLDGFFGLHPSLAPLMPLWQQGHMAMVHAAGSPDPTRSHFDAQDYMESGTPGIKSTPDGWLNRALQAEDERRSNEDRSPLRAIASSNGVPRTLEGRIPVAALENIGAFRQLDTFENDHDSAFQQMYDAASNSEIRGAGEDAFQAMRMLRTAAPGSYQPARGAKYPGSPFGRSLREIAQLMKGDYGVEVAFADVQGWDHHHHEGNVQGQLANSLRDFSSSLAAFWTDLGDQAENTVIVTMSEFGRTARENGTGGTDHGHANVMFVMGGPVRGRKVYGHWPGLANEQLYQNRDLAVTTDFRRVLSEAAWGTLGVRDLTHVFPGFSLKNAGFLGMLL